MTDYEMSRHSSRSFEHMLQALGVKLLGSALSIFGDGPDGGREATFDGKVPYPSVQDNWDGYGVVQVKFRPRPVDSKRDGDWAIKQLKGEIQKYLDPASHLRKPEYFIFATNVVLTPMKDGGSKDRLAAVLEEFKTSLPLKGFDIWDYDKIRVFLDNNQEVRRTYAAWITPGDVLSEVLEWITPKTPNLRTILHNFLQKELLSDEFVNLEQAGHDVNDRISLAQVFVDLPIVDETYSVNAADLEHDNEFALQDKVQDSHDSGFIKRMLAVSAERLDPKSVATDARMIPGSTEPPPARGRFVLIGGPGQGKTTVGQFICQIFRTSIISRIPETSQSVEIRHAVSLIASHCQNEDIDLSLVPRFPFRIVLNEFASSLSSSSLPNIHSVISYLTHQIRRRTDCAVEPSDLQAWFAQYPSIIIFDGLDEVPSSSNRDQVLGAIRDFWVDVSNSNADILSIATSRPQGYNEDFSPAYYHHQRLAPLTQKLGTHFARRLADVRYGNDLDRKERVLGRLERYFENVATSRLMRSPLQVTIMTALVDQMGQPPEARWNLFNAYYDVIYRREVERDIPASDILRQYRPDINAIHNRVGLLLQIGSEQSGRTDAKFSSQRFVQLVRTRLKEEGHVEAKLTTLTQQIVEAAAERLVFLVGLESDQVGFEIRSLQEFMAAECLMEGSDKDVEERLLEIAPLANWRNVFLFASGKCFGSRQHLRDAIHRICGTLNETDGEKFAGRYLVGSRLAMDLLDDGLSRNQPRFVQSLGRVAVRALDVPSHDFQTQLANVYENQLQSIYLDEIVRRLCDERHHVRIGTWGCLLHLVGRDIDWARQLADQNWPTDSDTQIDILQGSIGFWRNPWSAAKFLDLLLQYPVSRMRELFHIGTAVQLENNIYHQSQPNYPGDLKTHPHQESMFRILMGDGYELRFEITLLGERFSGISGIHTPNDESFWFYQLQNIGDCHTSWAVYKSAAKFLQNPSKEQLAQELRAIARLLRPEPVHRRLSTNSDIPWPLAACIDMCTNERDALDLAQRAASGDLGDRDTWLAAERRWRTEGVAESDIRSMSDERLPFDDRIDSTGFPLVLSMWPAFRPVAEGVHATRMLLELHATMEKGKNRVLVAGLAEDCFVGHSMYAGPVESEDKTTFDAPVLQRIYADLPKGRSVPLHAVVNRLSGSDEEILDFYRMGQSLEVDFVVYAIPRLFDKDSLRRTLDIFLAAPEHHHLITIIAKLAEQGHLPKDFENVPRPGHYDEPELRIALLIIMLAQESWLTDSVDRLIACFEDVMGPMSPDELCELYGRIIKTLENSRATGFWYEKFLLGFGELLDTDNYEICKDYTLLLQDEIRRRTSRFMDEAPRANFNLPVGITELI